ncbi:hypothetical protein BKA62DRAFT_801290 [Auriculariales sp. MPI-PUGE-AT-0066]|nr:hypothetical protein BKA62DRAFT_801290 [Auriculariales sp. MPI-PUGE-AT-0066]
MSAIPYDKPGNNPPDHFFPSPFNGREMDDEGALPRTLIELKMCTLSATLRDKPEWWLKFTDSSIAAKWKTEALAQGFTEPQIDYIIAELADYSKLREDASGAEVSCFDKIWQSDSLIPAAVLAELKAAVRKLEEVPEEEKDWHPRSNGQVLDLVHPSLYPLVYNRSLAKPDLTPVAPPPPDRHHGSNFSERFAWLPTKFCISEDGTKAKALSYINNVHPTRHKDLVSVLERIVAAYVPLFNRVLTDQLGNNEGNFPLRVSDDYTYNEDSEAPAPKREKGESTDDWWQRYVVWDEARDINMSEAEAYVPGHLLKREQIYRVNGQTIQIIVKLANIILTPNSPTYDGGSWHVEGMKNEAIVASGIYYYDEQNISESRLAFRQGVRGPENYHQSDSVGARKVWGLASNDQLVQDLGQVVISSSRSTVLMPSQHRVAPFELIDKSQPGHRKILALFLVNPTHKIPSTSIIAPQQANWIAEAVLDAASDSEGHLSKLRASCLTACSSRLTAIL